MGVQKAVPDAIAGYFPRIHTALAEWLICLAFIFPLRAREVKIKQLIIDILFLVPLLAIFIAMEETKAQGILWGVLMALGMAVMLGMIYLHNRSDWTGTVYCWAHAFLAAELAASLEWQINYELIRHGVISAMWQTYICMGIIYALVFSFIFFYRKRMDGRVIAEHITWREAGSAAGIAIGAFVISNIQFALQGSALSTSLGDGVLYARTLVDASGIIMLYANREQRREMYMRYELDAMTNLLQRQYEQYQQFEANNEAMHRVYHDLKHQIAYLESEKSPEKRMAGLKEMKEIIRTNESKVHTGNTVFDTLMTSKSLICADEGILMTCYADAKLIDFMDVMDVCSIFGNTIDNAIECARKVEASDDRLIKVYVGARGTFLLVRIENFCDKQVAFEGDTPVTTKEDKQLHGFGLKSVRKTAEKYHGHLNLEQANGWFTVTILIPLPTQSELKSS